MVAAVLTGALWLGWLMLSVALAPLGGVSDAARDLLGLGATASCDPDWVAVVQLAPPILAVFVPLRLARPRSSRWAPAVAAFLLLALVWWAMTSAGDCAVGSDDGAIASLDG